MVTKNVKTTEQVHEKIIKGCTNPEIDRGFSVYSIKHSMRLLYFMERRL